jgi:hypothetical protein
MAKYTLTRSCGCPLTIKLFGKENSQATLDRLQDNPCDAHKGSGPKRKAHAKRVHPFSAPYTGAEQPADPYALVAADMAQLERHDLTDMFRDQLGDVPLRGTLTTPDGKTLEYACATLEQAQKLMAHVYRLAYRAAFPEVVAFYDRVTEAA